MKKIILTTSLMFASMSLYGQVEVTSKKFNLKDQYKQANWKPQEAGIDASTGNIFVKISMPNCETSKSSDGSYVYTEFKGLSWTVDKLIFDPSFNYLRTESKRYDSSAEALLNEEYIYGKKYNAILGGSITSIIGSSLGGVAMPAGQIDNSNLFSTIVSGTSGIGGFKLGTSYIGIQLSAQTSKYGPDVCGENPAVYKVDVTDSKEEKGQKWIPIYNNPVPNGGNFTI